MSVSIREFTLDDYERVFGLWRDAGPGLGIGRSDTRDEIAKKLQHDPDLFLVAEEGRYIVGTVFGGFDGRRGIIYHLAVAEEYRRRGIGKMLMDELEQRMVAKGCLRSYLVVRNGNEDVIDFYHHLGWEIMNVTLMAKSIA